MSRSGSRRGRPAVPSRDRQDRRAQLLPMSVAQADREILPYRLALERIRCGQADFAAATKVCVGVTVAGLVTQAGYGVLPVAHFMDVSAQAASVIGQAKDTGEWKFTAALVDGLTAIINEYDRQLRETRLAVIRQAERDVGWAFSNRHRLEREFRRIRDQQ